MKRVAMKQLAFGAAALGLIVTLTGEAAQHGMPAGRAAGGPGAQQTSTMMRDMSGEMREIADQMAMGSLSAEQQKRMAQQMREMAGMMDNMSGMMGRGMMMDSDYQRRMDQMRERMDEMMKEPTRK